jgi:hypothetical protein
MYFRCRLKFKKGHLLKGHLLKLKGLHSLLNVCILSSTSVPFRPTAVQTPNLAQVETKRVTVYSSMFSS